MSRFLLKTEPTEYSFDDLVRDNETIWDGITNNLALIHIRSMRTGDECLMYHSGGERAIVGIAEVIDGAQPDPTKDNRKLAVVRIKPVRKLGRPVSLTELKSKSALRTFDLLRLPRLSVMPVPDTVWNVILDLSKEK